jgi:hypothetical protein
MEHPIYKIKRNADFFEILNFGTVNSNIVNSKLDLKITWEKQER